jgi:hypothetical protein
MVSINGRSAFLLNDWELSALAGGLFALFDELGQSEASPLAQLEEVA